MSCLPAFAAETPADVVAAWRTAPVTDRPALNAKLVKMGPDAVKVLLPEMRRRRIAALEILRQIGDKAVPELLKTLKDPAVGGHAREALFELAPQAAPARVPDFVACMSDAETRDLCGGALLRLAPKAASQTGAIAEALKAKDPAVRRYAIQALGMVGRKAKKTVPALQKLKNDDADADVRKAAQEALEKIQG